MPDWGNSRAGEVSELCSTVSICRSISTSCTVRDLQVCCPSVVTDGGMICQNPQVRLRAEQSIFHLHNRQHCLGG